MKAGLGVAAGLGHDVLAWYQRSHPHRLGTDIRRAVGTASAIGFVIAIPGTIGYIIAGWGVYLPPFTGLCSTCGADRHHPALDADGALWRKDRIDDPAQVPRIRVRHFSRRHLDQDVLEPCGRLSPSASRQAEAVPRTARADCCLVAVWQPKQIGGMHSR